MNAISLIAQRIGSVVLAQAARLIEQAARRQGRTAAVGGDSAPAEEPLRFVASDRMALTASDLAAIEGDARQPRIVANLLGLAGAAPALPPVYSELQLSRRRMRDRALAGFFNLFDHRALSFFYRIFTKYNWVVGVERAGSSGADPASRAVLALAGLGTSGCLDRLSLDDAVLVPLAAHLGDSRRSAHSIETILRQVTGLPLRIVEAEPTWMTIPPREQTRLGGPASAQFARLGGVDPETGMGLGDAALIGQVTLDVQHHYAIEIGPVDHATLIDFCARPESRRRVGDLCLLAAGIEHQPVIRLLIDAADVPPMRLGDVTTPAMLGWTGWLGSPDPGRGILADCTIPVERRG